MSENRNTPLDEFLSDLDAGILEQQLSAALSDVAEAVIFTGKAGKISVTFNVAQIKNFDQVEIKHSLNISKPTTRGKQSEEVAGETPMYVHKGGVLKHYPAKQGQLFGEKTK